VHLDTSDVTAKYAIKIDGVMKYAKEKETGDTGTEIDINGLTYIVSDNYTDTKFWADAYFNAATPTIQEDFNTVSVVINLDSSAATIDTFTNAVFTGAEIVMQTRPAKKSFLEIENNQFPGLIKF
jgi:uncharacterized glyoxalase superfamily protein PhnB